MRIWLLSAVPVVILASFAPAPLPQPHRAERTLREYCAARGIPCGTVVPCQVRLFPGSKVYRYRVPENARERLRNRHGILVMTGGSITELRLREEHSEDRCCEELLSAMRRAGKTVKSNEEAEEVFRDLHRMSYWLTGYGSIDEKALSELKVEGEYRGLAGTYGCGLWGMRLAGGDDLGIEVDREGFVAKLLSGHVK